MGTASKMLSKKAETTKKTTEKKAAPKTTAKKTAPKKAPAKKAATKSVDLIVSTANQMESLTKTKALNLVRTLLDEKNFNEFKLGAVLSVIQIHGYWDGVKDADGNAYANFKEFMVGEYGLQYRKGMYFIGIYNALVEAEIPWDKVKDVGWTKLKEIAPLLNLENVDEWVDRAMSMNTLSLIQYIKSLDDDGTPSGDKPATGTAEKVTTMTFKLHEDQRETVQSALDKAMKDGKTDVNTVALEYICMNYLEGKVGKVKTKTVTKKVPMDLKETLAAMDIEKAFEVIGEVFDQYDITVAEREAEAETE